MISTCVYVSAFALSNWPMCYALSSFVSVTSLRELVTSQAVPAIPERPISPYEGMEKLDQAAKPEGHTIPAGNRGGKNRSHAQKRRVRPTERKMKH